MPKRKLSEKEYIIMHSVASLPRPTSSISSICSALHRRYLHRMPRLLYAQSTNHNSASSSPETAVDYTPIADDDSVEESSKSNNIVEKINTVVNEGNLGRLFAVVQIAALQRKITTEDIIVVEGVFTPDIGDRIKLEKVLMVGSKDFSLVGRPMLNPDLVRIEATVIEKTLSHSKVRLTYMPRKRNQKFIVKQYFYTMLQINSIQLTKYDQSKSSVTYNT